MENDIKQEANAGEERDGTVLTVLPPGLFSILENDFKPATRTVERVTTNGTLLGILWLLALLLFGFGDTLASIMVFLEAGSDAGFILGGSIITFVIIKALILAALAVVSYAWFTAYSWLIPAVLIATGAYLVTKNALWLAIS